MPSIVTRLFWDGRRGMAIHDGVQIELRAAPDVGIAHLAELDFMPAVRHAELRESASGWRPMDANERAAAMGLLETIAASAHAAAATRHQPRGEGT